MKIKVSSKNGNPIHLWAFEDFKEHYHAVMMDYETQGGMIINYIVYEVQGDTIDLTYADENGFKVEVIKE